MKKELKIIECPRDAMQGIHEFIPTAQKADFSPLKKGLQSI